MSWWVYLERDGEAVPVETFVDGGTFAVGGEDVATMNVTYNYGGRFREAWPEPIEGTGTLGRMLDGRTARETIEPLRVAVERLGTERDPDYWAATPGNAGAALARLLAWAEQHPDAVWRIS